jgi:hypothetical protein
LGDRVHRKQAHLYVLPDFDLRDEFLGLGFQRLTQVGQW